jgi:ribonuclease PH
MTRPSGRAPDELRRIKITPAIQKDPAGSVLIEWGNTKVVCAVQVDEKVPHWLNGQGTGWITAEYGMLPGCSDKRIHRDKIRQTGRTHEIQRLIGRSIRACLDMKELGQRTFQIDCDVLQADGGTRVASITGAYLALRLALFRLKEKGSLKRLPQTKMVSAVSLGKLKSGIVLDLDYVEDVDADVDANVVMNEAGEFIEIQGTAEKGSFGREDFDQMINLATAGCNKLFEIQRKHIQEWGL